MLFRFSSDEAGFRLTEITAVSVDDLPKELDLERAIVGTTEPDDSNLHGPKLLPPEIFGEQLFLIGRQRRTKSKQRLDLLALDERGRLVVIELKRDEAQLGVDTQALQYVASHTVETGEAAIRRFFPGKGFEKAKEQIQASLREGYGLDDIAKQHRIILLARRFSESLFSIGEWLSEQGVAFRCIAYSPHRVGGEMLLSFSVVFDRSRDSIYRFQPESLIQRGEISCWLGLGRRDDPASWWQAHLDGGIISCGFDGKPDDRGWEILSERLQKKDRVFAYMSGVGAVGMGIVSGAYKLLDAKALGKNDVLEGEHPHRRKLQWKYWLDPECLRAGTGVPITPAKLREDPDLPAHPLATFARIRDDSKLLSFMAKMAESPESTGWHRSR